MLRLRLRWLVTGNGGFELVICRTLSELPIPPSLLSADARTDESDEIDNFFSGLLIAVGSFWWDVASLCFATECSDNDSSSMSWLNESSSSFLSQDLSSVRLLPNDFRNLSTNRTWNLFRLPWLPLDGFGAFGGLQFFVGLVSELCDVRDDVRENARELLRFM